MIRFDPPGVGGSPVPPLPYPFPLLARLVGRLLEPWVSSSSTCWASPGVAASPSSSRSRTRAAAAGWCWWPPRSAGRCCRPSPRVLLRMTTPRRHRDVGYARSIAGDIYGGRPARHPGRVQELATEHDRPASGRGYLYQLAAGPRLDQPAVPAAGPAATLILAGADDPLIPLVNARIMARLLPDARLHVYPDGHLGLLTRADELAAIASSDRQNRDSILDASSPLRRQRREPGGVLAQQRDQLGVRLRDAVRGPGEREPRDEPPVARPADRHGEAAAVLAELAALAGQPGRARPRRAASISAPRVDTVCGVNERSVADERPPVRLLGQQQRGPARTRAGSGRAASASVGGWSGSGSTSATCAAVERRRGARPSGPAPRRCSTTPGGRRQRHVRRAARAARRGGRARSPRGRAAARGTPRRRAG